MVGLVLVSHSRPLANAAADLIRRTINNPDLKLCSSGGIGDNREELGTDATEIQEAIAAVYSGDGVLVLMDMGSAILSAETAKEFLDPEQQRMVRLTSAPLVEGGISAAIQAQLGSSLDEVANAARQSLLPKQDQIQDSEPPARAVADVGSSIPAETIDVTILNPHGLHLRPAATLIKTLSRFPGEVLIENKTTNRGPVPVRSLVDVARLQIREGDSVRFSISAPDPKPAADAIRELVESQFGEGPVPATQTDTRPSETSQMFGVSGGIVVGRILFLDSIPLAIPSRKVETSADEAREAEQLKAATLAAAEQFDLRIERLRPTLRDDHLRVFEAQRMILADSTIYQEVRTQIENQHLNSAAAWHSVLSRYAAEQEQVEDHYLRDRAADFREVERMVLSHLVDETEGSAVPHQAFATPTLVVCEELTPTLAEQFHRDAAAGVIQLGGGTTSHGAILARAFALPSIGGARDQLDRLKIAQKVAIDGSKGLLWIDPEQNVLDDLLARQLREKTEREQTLLASREPCRTKDGIRVQVGANAGSAGDISSAMANGADFVGLFRSEFLFQKFDREPDAEAQLAAYQEALAPSNGTIPITIRLLDVGGDKPLKFLPQSKEANPFLGVRGIRLLTANPRFFRTHLEAILRLAHSFPVQILIPMITDIPEVLATKKLLTEIAKELKSANIPHRWPIPLGAMVETPSAGILIDQLLAHLDFISIGTNDLTQYVLCAERGNASLAKFSDALHPAVLEICERIIDTAVLHRKKASICGEIASDPDAVPIWLGLGLREISIAAAAIPAIKSLVRQLETLRIAKQLDSKLHTFTDPSEVRNFSRTLTQLISSPQI
jgi:multiphosphoryl transfer protein